MSSNLIEGFLLQVHTSLPFHYCDSCWLSAFFHFPLCFFPPQTSFIIIHLSCSSPPAPHQASYARMPIKMLGWMSVHRMDFHFLHVQQKSPRRITLDCHFSFLHCSTNARLTRARSKWRACLSTISLKTCSHRSDTISRLVALSRRESVYADTYGAHWDCSRIDLCFRRQSQTKVSPFMGLEPIIFGLEVQRLVH